MLEKIVSKLISGRFLLTMIAGGVFIYAVCMEILTAETTGAILTMVFVSYFNRNDRQPPKSNDSS